MAKSIWRTNGDIRAATVWATLSTTLGCSRMILRVNGGRGGVTTLKRPPPASLAERRTALCLNHLVFVTLGGLDRRLRRETPRLIFPKVLCLAVVSDALISEGP